MRCLQIICVSLLLAARAWALETDQFTVPAKRLPDMAPALESKVAAELSIVVEKANARRDKELRLAASALFEFSRKMHRERADQAVSGEVLAEALYMRLAGIRVPECRIELWLRDPQLDHSRNLQSLSVEDSIYGSDPFQRPFFVVDVAPTIRLYEQYLGTDKVGHLFQAGHDYFTEYSQARSSGRTEAQAIAAAVAWGARQERAYYGQGINGIYSNADLAANFSGMLFYRNLRESIQIDSVTLEPLVILEGNRLRLSDRAGKGMLKPLIGEHLNEAMNPPKINSRWRPFFRGQIARRSQAWLSFYESSLVAESQRLERVKKLFGYDYGHTGPDGLITIVNAADPDAVASR